METWLTSLSILLMRKTNTGLPKFKENIEMKETCQNNAVRGVLSKSRLLNRHTIIGFFILTLGLSLLCSYSAATTILPVTFDESVSKAEQIFIGWVEEIRSEFNDDETQIYTYATFQVLETIEGTEPQDSAYTIRLTGGQVGDKHLVIVGMPEFEIGEMVLLFVHLNNRAMCPIVGWSQGYYRIDGQGPQMVVTDYCHNPIVGVDDAGVLMRADSPAMAQRGYASPGVSVEEEGNAGTLVVNQYNSLPAMNLEDFAAVIRNKRASFGYEPEAVSDQDSHVSDQNSQRTSIPVDFNEFLEQAVTTIEPVPPPGGNDARMPRPITVIDEISADSRQEKELSNDKSK